MTGGLEHPRKAASSISECRMRACAPAQFGDVKRATLLERIKHDNAFVERQTHEKMPGNEMPSSGKSSRWASSICTTASEIGLPKRRSSTSFR